MLEAKSVSFGNGDGKGRGKGDRKLAYNTKDRFNGNLMVGMAYTAMLELQPGDQFEIRLSTKQIRLVPIGGIEGIDEIDGEE